MKRIVFTLLIAIFCLTLLAYKNKSKQSYTPVVHFFAFGDAGSGSQDQKEVANQTRKVCSELSCDFGLLLGDNFYERGVRSVEDPLWKSRYKDIYQGLDIPFYVVLGNHDWVGNPQAEVDYSKHDQRWKMPAFFYSIKFPEEKPLLEIFVLNSNDFNTDSQNWLKKALSDSKAKWKILAFHHPILSVGDVHPPDQKKMWPALKEIVCRKVDLILSGHEHIFAHLRQEPNECKYDQLIIGTGGKKLYGITTTSPDTLKLSADASFGTAWFEVTVKKIQLKFFRMNGENSYNYTWKK